MRVEHIGDATLYLADCMDVMRDMPDNAFELAIVDPPYGLGVNGDNIIPNKSGDLNHKYDSSKMWDTDRPPPEYFDELRRVSVNQIIWGGNYYFDILGLGGGIVIWDKLNGESLYADGELAWVSRGLQKRLRIFRHQWCGAFKASERGEDKIHPTQKPVALYKWLLKNYAKPGNKILDTHGGSGSSVIACLDMGYEIMWIEKDPDYFEAALKRIKDFAAQPKLPMDDTPEPVEQWLGFEEEL